jgi:hypothetical protein
MDPLLEFSVRMDLDSKAGGRRKIVCVHVWDLRFQPTLSPWRVWRILWSYLRGDCLYLFRGMCAQSSLKRGDRTKSRSLDCSIETRHGPADSPHKPSA